MGDTDFCRLCAETKPYTELLAIDDDESIKQNLHVKIARFFHVQILEDDKLPRNICVFCCHKVNFTWNFNERVQQAQEALCALYLMKGESATVVDPADIALAKILPDEEQVLPKTSTPDDIVQCLINDRLGQTVAPDPKLMAPELPPAEIVTMQPMDLIETPNSNEVKKKPAVNKDLPEKRKPTKARKGKRKNTGDPGEKAGSEDESFSELSGISDAERNEDGSLILSRDIEGWDSYPWLCADCDAQLSNMIDLKSHHQSAHNQTPKFMCVDCPKVYTKYYGFITHVRVHRQHLKYCCDCCGKFFPDKKLLDGHRSTHFDAKPYSCKTCGKSFRLQSALYVHSRSHLPVEVKNKYACDQCPKRFGTKPNLMAHKRIHTGVRDYTCDQCGKSFIQKGNLDNHLLTHTLERPYSCETCGKSFKTLIRLKKHGSVHSGLKPYQCDVCGRQFRERGTLKEHHRIHTGAMPFSCEYCGKTFRFKGVLTTHRRQHTGERPYSCHECQHHFTNWPNYNKHMKRRHGINTSVTTRKPQAIPPTGMPQRNPPGAVLATPSPPQQPTPAPQQVFLQMQDTNSAQSNASFGEQEIFVQQQQLVQPRQQQPQAAGQMQMNGLGGQLVNVQPAVLAQSYYMPGVIGLYNIQGMEAAELMAHQPR